jgi:(5-formylfuran-3-yl)methyl phosphate synthase
MTIAFLASVTSVAEATLAVDCGCDIIDCKDPSQGALGALPVKTVASIRRSVSPQVRVSATVGDLTASLQISQAVSVMATSGCDLVKIGFFPGGNARETVRALADLDLPRTRLVGLLLADCEPEFTLIAAMADAGFTGVMLDTAGKTSGGLLAHLAPAKLLDFVLTAHKHGLFAGFAGSLQLSDIATLMRLKPDVMGFRGALCTGATRTNPLNAPAIRAVRAAISDHRAECIETERA